MRSKSGTVRLVNARHRLDKLKGYARHRVRLTDSALGRTWLANQPKNGGSVDPRGPRQCESGLANPTIFGGPRPPKGHASDSETGGGGGQQMPPARRWIPKALV